MLLGRYPHNCGKAGELHRPFPAFLAENAFTARLRGAGYHAELVGKHHLAVEFPDGRVEKLVEPAFDREQHGFVRGNRSGAARWAERVRDRPADTPCVFWFASTDAHRPWDADRDWDAAKYGPKHDPAAVVLPSRLVETPETRADFASHLNEVTRFDYHVGTVLDALEEQGVADETLVIVTSDNGRPFPRAKTRLHDPGVKMPLLLRLPKGFEVFATTDALASAVDLAPTILEVCGVAVPETVQCLSLLPTLTESAPVRRYAFSEHNRHNHDAHGRSVRDAEGFLYVRNARPVEGAPWVGPSDSIRSPAHQDLRRLRDEVGLESLDPAAHDLFVHPRPAEELYAPEDALQTGNLVGDAEHAEKLSFLRDVTDRWQIATADDVPEEFWRTDRDLETGEAPPRPKRPRWEADHYETARDEAFRAATVNEPGPF